MSGPAIDLDSLQWWGLAAHRIVTFCSSIGAVVLLWIDRIEKAEEKLKWFEHHVERRKTMSVIDEIKLLIGIVPKIEKVLADAKAAEQTPQTQALITDIEAIVAEVKAVIPQPAPPPPPPAAAPPEGQV